MRSQIKSGDSRSAIRTLRANLPVILEKGLEDSHSYGYCKKLTTIVSCGRSAVSQRGGVAGSRTPHSGVLPQYPDLRAVKDCARRRFVRSWRSCFSQSNARRNMVAV